MLQSTSKTAPIQLPSSKQAWFVVIALSIASIVSWIDRQIINLLVEPIKADLALTDVQISLLQGFSFALLYAFMALPLAWLADRHNRKWVILGGLICWSAATFSSGLAIGFAVLFITRMLVGIGEATLAPAGFSIISDYFSKEKLPAAVSVFTGSGFIGSGFALMVGGFLYAKLEAIGPQTLPFGTFAPWQLTFMAVALLSVPVFFLLLFVREPQRRDDTVVLATDDAPPALEVISFLRSHLWVFAPLMLGFACFVAAQYGIGSWAPSFFIRVYGWTQLEVGQYFGPVVMLAGIGGVVVSGFLAERWLAQGIVDATIRLPVYAIMLAIPCAVAFPLVGNAWASLALLGLVIFLGTVPFGAGVSTFPLITPNRMRAQVVAVYLLIANLLGYSAGPILIAWLTDSVFASPEAIDKSLAVASPAIMVVGVFLCLAALRPYRALAAASSTTQSSLES
ncbi:MFS transporter [Altererythrobacter sp. BO-6]|uniref:spinster family MFS transporter n=1 Tax=Altererythrobacter sp. BO-6 TaxID=2604537 RepID=UPI0013E1D6EC|nr:MFS transporter [Altererythrobacter sp. BO-6]QIG53621.1 MFS transporter [Altererythrobacter sp. BO-6]